MENKSFVHNRMAWVMREAKAKFKGTYYWTRWRWRSRNSLALNV